MLDEYVDPIGANTARRNLELRKDALKTQTNEY